jgi:plasmid replication initiation protein
MVAIELRLSDWLYSAVLACEVLTLNRDYFRISGGLDRRLFELAREHCGSQGKMDHQHQAAPQEKQFTGYARQVQGKA